MRWIYIANKRAWPACCCTKRVRSGEKLAWLGLQEGALLAYVEREVPALTGWAFFFCGNGPRAVGCEDV